MDLFGLNGGLDDQKELPDRYVNEFETLDCDCRLISLQVDFVTCELANIKDTRIKNHVLALYALQATLDAGLFIEIMRLNLLGIM